MLPPLNFVGPANDPYSLAIVDSAAPLSRWLPMNDLQERLARNLRESVNTERDKKDVETLIEIWLGKYQCVATDDPRLKEKYSSPGHEGNGPASPHLGGAIFGRGEGTPEAGVERWP
jgi:hypothetical protein